MEPPANTPSATSRIFEHTVRVPYAHVDQMGFVYYAHYFVYFEMARSEMLREAGLPYPEMERRGVLLPVVEARCQYRKPARYDDALRIRTRCTGFRGPRLCLEYEISREGEVLATGATEHVCMSRDGKVLRPVPELRRLSASDGSR
jgi:acyl-CoA thioester hydrolase